MDNNASKISHDLFDPEKLTEAVANAAEQSHDMMQQFLENPANAKMLNMDPMGVGQAFLDVTLKLMQQPEKFIEAQKASWDKHIDLWADAVTRMIGKKDGSGAEADGGRKKKFDKRFKHDSWEKSPFFEYVKDSYLVTSEAIQSLVSEVEHDDPKAAAKAEFYTRVFVDAMSPSNFALTNPEVIERTIQSKGDNLVKGMQNFMNDFDTENGELRMRMTDQDAFELGENVAVSPGKIVFQNRMLQLVQYTPTTEKVHKRPLLIIPPWINKFYVLDLQPKNSLIKWAVDQGHTVFVVSWVNPDESYRDVDFEDYVLDGVFKALDAVKDATGEETVNAIGYCIGGTLLAGTLALMAERKDKRIASASFFTTMLDFSDPGDLGVFIDETQIQDLEKAMNERGYHDGKDMAMTFNLMRSNDLIWSFYVSNYLMGNEPFPFDLLYWNSDSTRMPAKMHSTYLRCMYHENKFKEPGGVTIDGVDIDLTKVKTPSYFISAQDDHIAPWKSTFLGTKLFTGPMTFTLGKSGHIAGVVNPPAANKYGYFTGPNPAKLSADEWFEKTKAHDGSWWNNWDEWVGKQMGKDAEQVPARQPGDGKLKALEDAPGSYVKVRSS